MSTFVPPTRSNFRGREGLHNLVRNFNGRIRLDRQRSFGALILAALLAFEVFNYGTTEFALTDLLGELRFSALRWSTILALAFCIMDFAGIARLFTQDEAAAEPTAVWYLLGAWFIAATMNAMLTWWAVSLALIGHQGLGNEVIGREALLSGVPIFVAILVWLIRVLIIGTFTVSGEHLLTRMFGRGTQVPRQIESLSPAEHVPPKRSNGSRKPLNPAPKPYPSSIPRRSPPQPQSPIAARPAPRR